MFAADASVFLLDLGDPVSWTPSLGGPVVSGLMIFDQPAEEIDGGKVISRSYVVTFESTAWPGLKRGEPLTIGGSGGGAVYTLRHDPMPEGDAVFSTARLSKV